MTSDRAGSSGLPSAVLVVEDDAVLALNIEETLREAGIGTVTLTSTTEDALAVLRKSQPDAIILDVHLADRDDGWAVAELLQTLGPQRPQIIFSTGSPDEIPEEIAAIGIVLAKPYDPEQLLQALREPKARGLFSRLRGVLR